MNDKPTSPWMTTNEAAAYLKIKPRTLQLWARLGKIKAYPISGSQRKVWRFLQADLDTALGSPGPARTNAVLPLAIGKTSHAVPTSEWLTPNETATYLRVKPCTVLRWAREERLKGHMLSGSTRHVWRFRKADLDSTIEAPSIALEQRRVR